MFNHPKPRPDLKPKRLPKRKRMTAILGMNCFDGVLLLADTEESLGGDAKSESDKLHRFTFPIGHPAEMVGTVITGGSGDTHLIECANQELERFFQTEIEKDTDVLIALNAFATTFFSQTLSPYEGISSDQIPFMEMLIVVNFRGRSRLFCWKKGRVLAISEDTHDSVGCGDTQIHPMLRDVQFSGGHENMLLHGIRMMRHAKRSVTGVGGKTEAEALLHDGSYRRFGTLKTEKIEELVVNLEEFCIKFLYNTIANPEASEEAIQDSLKAISSGFFDYRTEYKRIIENQMTKMGY